MATRKRNVVQIEVIPQNAGIAEPPLALGPEDLQEVIGSVSRAVVHAMELAKPDSCTVEFSLGWKGTSKFPVVLAGEVSAAFKVSLTWKKAASARAR